jgi:hypothetical protein
MTFNLPARAGVRSHLRAIKMWRNSVALVACAAHVAGCASSPDSIEGRYVSPTTYQNWTCDQLADERVRLTKEVDRVSGLQRENANADVAMMTVGIIIFWPMLFGLAATKDRKDELSRLKGEYDAVDLSSKAKQCTRPVPGVPSMPSVPTPESAAMMVSAEGTYKGVGKTDSWCQAPTMTLTLKGDTFDGQLSEISSGATTSAISGTLDNTGVVSLEFKGSGTHFTGKVDGALKDNVLTIAFRSKAASACNYRFELKKVSANVSALSD